MPLPSPSIEPSPAGHVLVRVVRGFGDEPAPGVVVEFAREVDEHSELGLEHAARGDTLYNILLGPRRRFRTGDDGWVRLPATREEAVATCSDGESWGFLDLAGEPPGAKLVLRLLPDPPLRVRVVDGAGAPVADAEVGLFFEDDWGDGGRMAVARSAADGVAELRRVRASTSFYDGGLSHRMIVGLVGLFEPPVGAPFDPRALPLELELVMPPCSAVDVELRDADGGPWRGAALVELGIAREDWWRDERRQAAAFARNGRARFDRVGCDLPLDWDVRGPGVERRHPDEPAAQLRSAPAPGGVVTCTLPVQAAFPPLRATLLLPDGMPCAQREVRAVFGAGWSAVARDVAWTDASGALSLGDRNGDDLASIDLVVAGGAGFLVAHASVADSTEPGAMDLGVLRLARAAPALAGRAVDERGAPIAGASVRLSASGGGDSSLPVWAGSTAADGSFAAWFRAEPHDALRLDAKHRDHHALRDLPVAAGKTGVELVLARAGVVEAVVLVDDEWLCGPLRAKMEPNDGEGSRARGWVSRQGELRIEGLEPGTYALRIVADDTDAEVHVQSGVVVRAGEVARLAPIDLRGALHPLRLDVADGDGAPLDAVAWFRAGAGHPWTGAANVDQGILVALANAPLVDVAVHHGRFRLTTFEGVRSGDRLVLRRPALAIRVRVAGLAELEERGEELAIVPSLWWDAPHAPTPFLAKWLGGERDVRLAGPGPYRLQLDVRRRHHQLLSETLASFHLPFEVADVDEPQEIELALPPALVELVELVQGRSPGADGSFPAGR